MTGSVVIVSGCRTAIGTFGGTLKDIPVTTLAACIAREAIARSGLSPHDIQHSVRQRHPHRNLHGPVSYALIAERFGCL